ncbi:unnamed protein product, partial [Iphiclides podalirius]
MKVREFVQSTFKATAKQPSTAESPRCQLLRRPLRLLTHLALSKALEHVGGPGYPRTPDAQSQSQRLRSVSQFGSQHTRRSGTIETCVRAEPALRYEQRSANGGPQTLRPRQRSSAQMAKPPDVIGK